MSRVFNTYCVGDLDFVNPLERRAIKEDQFPVAFLLLHRRPRQHESVVGAEAAVGPETEQQGEKKQKNSTENSQWAPRYHCLLCLR